MADKGNRGKDNKGRLKVSFKELDGASHHPAFGAMKSPDKEQNKKNRLNFQKFWGKTKEFACELGWGRESVEANINGQLYLPEGPSQVSSQVFISPWTLEGFLLIRVTPKLDKLEKIFEIMHNEAGKQHVPTEVTYDVVPRNGEVDVIHVKASLFDIFGNNPSPSNEYIEQKLLDYVKPFINALQA